MRSDDCNNTKRWKDNSFVVEGSQDPGARAVIVCISETDAKIERGRAYSSRG